MDTSVVRAMLCKRAIHRSLLEQSEVAVRVEQLAVELCRLA
jgi:hypothetical protein